MKQKVQLFGRTLSAMVMPNIAAFIAWGFITALFIGDGWIPNEKFAALVGPMSSVLLPLLIAFTGGFNVSGHRGGVLAAITTMGLIVGSDIPMFLGAMIMGPLCGWVMKKFDKAIEGKVKAGFEMLVNNFSLGLIGLAFVLLALQVAAPVVSSLNTVMAAGVNFFVEHSLLPLASILIEPAKVLFLNNAINHGILTPIATQEVAEAGKSLLFLLEANPGPGLGILLAYCFFGKGSAKSSAPGAVIIHFLGGIHEIYFPYILMNPLLLIAAIAGGATGILVETILGAALTGAAAPGSILAILAMTAPGSYVGVIAGVAAAAGVSFALSMVILKVAGKDEDLEAASAQMKEMKAESKGTAASSDNAITGKVNFIVFACDAGMGSSAMGATVLKKKLTAAGITDIKVEHAPVSSIPKDAQIVVTHQSLGERAAASNPSAKLVLITNFLGAPEYDTLVEELKQNR
ncbi:MAG: PTS mannitol transporter subunit IICBA [Lachnospiraceae bacterium]|nr:PTS mannitol transporter subunit IICBA [Lachnospiraceae bacterium]